jgi:hypothetical protein
MIINDFNIAWPIFLPDKTDAILVIYPNTILTLSIPFEGFLTVTRRNTQFIQRLNRIQLIQFAGSYAPQRSWTSSTGKFGIHAVKNILCALILE